MDTYLAIAQNVIREARRPLSAHEILKRAYPTGGVPRHLHGRTQHKTLGARLAEDILSRGDRSLFFRNGPGRYFLTEFIGDPSIPYAYQQRFIARRRQRQLAQSKPLTIKRALLPNEGRGGAIPTNKIIKLLVGGMYHYAVSTKELEQDDVVVWSFVMVAKGSKVLTYRHGQYREDRDTFRHKRAIGFFAPVVEGDRTLFDFKDHGIVSRGLNTVSIDLGLNTSVKVASPDNSLASLECFVSYVSDGGAALLRVRTH